MSLDCLLQKQNADGGWPYRRGASWTEPTVHAVLALLAAGEPADAQPGIDWLRRMRLPDGGWPACKGIEESCWTTALVALVPPDRLGAEFHKTAIWWLLGTTGEESTWTYRLRRYLTDSSNSSDPPGWPWVPRAAAWVGPTSLAMLALDRERQRNPSGRIEARLAEGRQFLMNRMCRGGGWNHGSMNALGYAADPYPETTGMALAALRHVRTARVESSVAAGVKFLQCCRSADAVNWLRLGLSAHGALPPGYVAPPEIQFRTVPEIAMNALLAAGDEGRNWLWA